MGYTLKMAILLLGLLTLKFVSSFPNHSPLVSTSAEAFVITSTEPTDYTTFPYPGNEEDELSDIIPTTSAPFDLSNSKGKLEIQSVHIQSDIRYRYSRTFVTSKVANLDIENSHETTFRVVLPEEAFISKFIMEIDGKAYEAIVKEKEAAKQVYQQAQNNGQSAGLVELSTRNSNIFNVNVNIKPQSKVFFNLTYEELLSRKLGRYEQTINIIPEQLTTVSDFQIVVNIEESQNITFLRVPRLEDNEVEPEEHLNSEQNNTEAVITRPAGNKVSITWSPTSKDQKSWSKSRSTGKFSVLYDINRESNAGEILLMEGYFVHFFAPEDLPTLRRHVVFVLDTSGSMEGRKMEQLKESMKKILDDLSPEDFFNIITFSSIGNLWIPSKNGNPLILNSTADLQIVTEDRSNLLHPAIKENVAEAKAFIDTLVAVGGTNIHDSLMKAISLTRRSKEIRNQNSSTRNVESMILFLTDGDPTEGVTDPSQIQDYIHTANADLQIPIYSLGFGDGVHFPFLKKLSLQNFGFARKIYEASDSVIQLQKFYNEISSPLLSNVVFNYTSSYSNISDVTTTVFPSVLSGKEVVIAGRIDHNDDYFDYINDDDEYLCETYSLLAVKALISGVGYGGQMSLDSPSVRCLFDSPKYKPLEVSPVTTMPPPKTREDRFLERLWAYLTIKQLVNKDIQGQKSGSDDKVVNEESPKQHVTRLALKYKFVTPYTSLVVVKPNSSEVTETVSSDEKVTETIGLQQASISASLSSSFSAYPDVYDVRESSSSFEEPVEQSYSYEELYSTVQPPKPNNAVLEDIDETMTTTPYPSTPTFSLSSVMWFNPQAPYIMQNGIKYQIVTNLTLSQKDAEFEACEVLNSPGNVQKGRCQHMITCLQSEYVNSNSTDVFMEKYFCPIKSLEFPVEYFAGTCCLK